MNGQLAYVDKAMLIGSRRVYSQQLYQRVHHEPDTSKRHSRTKLAVANKCHVSFL